ncbi:putative protease [Malonomonas rubra DSM 5091]|uniref:Putative protease n=1 Tax=Malonomonas rubra DSM 5091 TaxID=1122189 RepID=A0A1M6INK9_MALRU|nr:U32 family peptidase [Malonomonas rubra]SHJ35929.1 putative protease [Malonomonas rubra DSM 5091]
MTVKQPNQRPELLAPAGSFEAFFAAAEAGADAVYTGLKDFSARAKARNFTLADIEKLTHYLQRDGKRLYVTLNTLVKEAELSQLIDTLGALEQIGVDAVILQDLAVWKLARDHFPGLELHSSTQMTVHNSAGVKMLERMGFTRGVLARELSLAEIGEIRRNTTLELEHFIHGALCFSFSGQCYFSSFLGGKSGNRGRCAQPCRRRHNYRQQQGYYFSTNDLSAIDLLPELEQAGICSLKIEGRMKSAEYVYKVVGAYRRALDAAPGQRKAVIKEAKQLLKESFGRQPTKGFLPGGQPSDIAIPSVKGATGRYLGDVAKVRGGEISFKTRDKLHLGDRLRVQPASDKAGTAFTIRQLMLGKRTVKQVPSGSFVTVPSTFQGQFKVGDGVFMVSSSTAFAMSDAACKRKLSQVKPSLETVDLGIEATEQQLRIEANVAGQKQQFEFAIDSYPAESRGLDVDTLQQVFAATAGEPFRLGKLDCGELPEIVIPPKQLKQIRRELYTELRQLRQPQKDRLKQQHLQAARNALFGKGGTTSASRELRVQLRDARDQRILQDPQVDQIIIPLTGQNLQSATKLTRRAEQVIWDIPFIVFDRDWKEMRNTINQLIQAGFRKYRLNNLGHFPFFDKQQGLELFSSFRLFSLNSQAVASWAELGINEAELYIEDDRDNLADLLSRELPLPTALTVYASVPLLVSRIAIKGVRADNPVRSDRDDEYRVQQRQGLTWLTSETDFSFISNMQELQDFGCHNFIVDLSHLGPFSANGKKVLEALKRGADPAGSSKFNYLMGME